MVIYEDGIPLCDECFLLISKIDNELKVDIFKKMFKEKNYIKTYYLNSNKDLFNELLILTENIMDDFNISYIDNNETGNDYLDSVLDITRYIHGNIEKEF